MALQDQFPSNVYPWRELAADRGAQVVTISRGGNDGWTPRILDAIDADTAIVFAQFSMERILPASADAHSAPVVGPASEGVAYLRQLLTAR